MAAWSASPRRSRRAVHRRATTDDGLWPLPRIYPTACPFANNFTSMFFRVAFE